jgi:hypothetical protein
MSKNQRQMPKTTDYLSNPLFWDLVYAYIQVHSEWDGVVGHPRILKRKDVNFSKIAGELGITRQTVSKRFADLGEEQAGKKGLGLIKKLENGDYEIEILPKEIATLVSNETLRIMTSACSDRTISAYLYLYSRWCANNQQEFKFTYSQLKTAIGLKTSTRSNDYIIKDILNVMIKLELIEIELKYEITDNGGYTDIYYVKNMGTEIQDTVGEMVIQEKKKLG